jgi:hypothetical protein
MKGDILRRIGEDKGLELNETEADEIIREMKSDSELLSAISIYLAELTGTNAYIGADKTGNVIGGASSLDDLASRFLIAAKGVIDEGARDHDLVYWTTQDPVKRAEADRVLSEQAHAVGGIQGLLIGTAMDVNAVRNDIGAALTKGGKSENAQNRFSDIAQAMGLGWFYSQPHKLREGGFNPYGNGQPTTMVGVLKMILGAVSKLSESWSSTTPQGFVCPNSHGRADVLVPARHDEYFINRCKSRVITTRFIPSVINGTVSVWTSVPNAIPNVAGGGAVVALDLNAQKTTLFMEPTYGGSGPSLSIGTLGQSYEDGVKQVYQLLRAVGQAGALANGNDTYIIYAATMAYQNESLISTSGSNAYILANIWSMSIYFDVNCRFMPIHRHIRGLLVKPSAVLANGAVLFPSIDPLGVTLNIWAGTQSEFVAYVMGQTGPGAAINGALFTAQPVFVFLTGSQSSRNYLEARSLYMLAHVPANPWDRTETYAGSTLVGGVMQNIGLTGTPTMSRQKVLFPLSGARVLNMVVIFCNVLAQQGAMGQAAQIRSTTFGVLPGAVVITTNNNNPFTDAVGQAPVASTAAALALGAQVPILGSGKSLNLAQQFWAESVGSKRDFQAAKVMLAHRLARFSPTPCVTTVNPVRTGLRAAYNCWNLNNDVNLGIPALTALEYTAHVGGRMTDMFGQECAAVGDRGPNYSHSMMQPITRLAVTIGVRDIKDAFIKNAFVDTATAVPAFDANGLYLHSMELAELIRLYIDQTYSTTGMSENALRGNMLNEAGIVAGVDAEVELSKSIVDGKSGIMSLLGIDGILTTDPVRNINMISCDYYRCTTVSYDKDFDAIDSYTRPSNSINHEPFMMTTTTQNLGTFGVGAAVGIDEVVRDKSEVTDVEKFSNWLTVPYVSTWLNTVAPRGYDIYSLEENTNSIRPYYVNLLYDTFMIWVQKYKGTVADIQARPFNTDFTLIMTDYTRLPTLGPVFLADQRICMSENAANNLNSAEIPDFVAYGISDANKGGFNKTKIRYGNSKLSGLLAALNGGEKGDKAVNEEVKGSDNS